MAQRGEMGYPTAITAPTWGFRDVLFKGEELELNPGLKLNQVVNLAINRTLSRTILTSLTTLLVTVSLLIFGTGIIRDFAFTFVVGILTGTFSSVFIASPVFYWWHKGDRRHVESHSDVLPKYEWEAGKKSKA